MTATNFEFEDRNTSIIDVHFHHFPQVLRDLGEFTIANPDETDHAMDLLKTTTVILSPVLWSKYNTEWEVKKWAKLCRDLTDAQAEEVRKNPVTRGSFAPLPLPHVQETLEAIRYGEENCNPRPDGYAITTSANNHYLGDQVFAPIWEECDRRGLVLFVHPSETVDPPLDKFHYGFQMIEFPTETASIKWIFSHNGGSFPFLFQRVIRTLTGSKLIGPGGPGAKKVNRIADNNAGLTLQQVFAQGNAYFECSQGTAVQQTVLRNMGVPHSRILTGSDWPFTGKDNLEATLAEMNGPEASGLFSTSELTGIRAGNYLAIAPRLAEAWLRNGLVRNK